MRGVRADIKAFTGANYRPERILGTGIFTDDHNGSHWLLGAWKARRGLQRHDSQDDGIVGLYEFVGIDGDPHLIKDTPPADDTPTQILALDSGSLYLVVVPKLASVGYSYDSGDMVEGAASLKIAVGGTLTPGQPVQMRTGATAPTDLSGYTNFKVWAKADGTTPYLWIGLYSGITGPEFGAQLTLTSAWAEYSIPTSGYTVVDLTTINRYEFKLEGASIGNWWIDDLGGL